MISKPEIRRIALDKNTLNKLLERIKNPHVSESAKNRLVKKVAGGFCCDCEGVLAKIVSYESDTKYMISELVVTQIRIPFGLLKMNLE